MHVPTIIALVAALPGLGAAPVGHMHRAGPAGRAAVSAAAPTPTPTPALSPTPAPAFDPGRWELRPRGGGAVGAVETVCAPSLDRLLRLRHEAVSGCEQFALKAPPGEATIQYTCRGRGYGRTHLRFETARLLQLDTQGVFDGLPFELSAEARRTGDCPG